MGRETWNIIKSSKGFYIRTYRKGIVWVAFSLALNLLLSLAIYFAHFHQTPPDYYATSGVAFPIQLKPLSAPNYSNQPLLEPDPVNEDETRAIPQ